MVKIPAGGKNKVVKISPLVTEGSIAQIYALLQQVSRKRMPQCVYRSPGVGIRRLYCPAKYGSYTAGTVFSSRLPFE